MKVWSTLDYAFFESLSADPTVGVAAGRFYYHSVSKMMRWYNGTTWSEVVDTASAQTLAQKTFTAPVLGVASATSLAVSGTGGAGFLELAEQSSAPSNPAAAKLRVYGKTTDEGLYFLNSSGTESQVGSGSGEKNYLSTGSSTAASWATSGAGELVATDTTGAELPRPNTTKTGIKLTGVSGSTAYAYYRFILDDADAGKKLKVQFDMRPVAGYVASDFKIDVYSNTASDYTTGNTRLSLSTDSSAVSALPALTGTYRTTFDAPAVTAKWIEVRVGLNGANTHSLVISDVVVGPGVVQQGAAVTQWVASTGWTNTVTTNATTTVMERRVGDTADYDIQIAFSGVNTQGAILLTLPPGRTIDYSKLGSSYVSARYAVGQGTQSSGASGSAAIEATLAASGSNSVYLMWYDTSTAVGTRNNVNTTAGNPYVIASGDRIQVRITNLPIAEWAGSGTVNVVQNDVEYVSNLGTAGTSTSDTTAFAYGPSGSQIGGITSLLSRRVRFQAPIQANDKISIEVSDDRVFWCPIESYFLDSTSAYVINAYMTQSTSSYGVGRIKKVSSTDLDVSFGTYASQNTANGFAGAGNAWGTGAGNAGNGYWRVKKVSGGQAVGFSEVNPGVSSGLVSASGLKGFADNSNAPTGYVAETQTQSRLLSAATSMTTGTTLNVTASPLVLTPGDWDVDGVVGTLPAATTTITNVIAGLSNTSATVSGTDTVAVADATGQIRGTFAGGGIAWNVAITIPLPRHRVSVAAGTTVTLYLIANATFATSTMTTFGSMSARRVR